jgi:hypothetical protein
MPDKAEQLAQNDETATAEVAAATIWKLLDASEDGFTRLVAPLLVAFTLPTIAVIVTTRDLPAGANEVWRSAVLALLITSTGLLLGSIQLSVGTLRKPKWSSKTRAALTYCGLGALTFGIITLVLPAIELSSGPMTILWVVALLVLVLGVGIPMSLQMRVKIPQMLHHDAASTSDSATHDI